MMLFGRFTRRDINQGVEEWKNTEGAVLLDVRTREEYDDYHIDGSVNLPLHELEVLEKLVVDRQTPLFVHCLSGSRSARAAAFLKGKGYSRVYDIGGLHSYRGETTSCSTLSHF